MRFALAFLVLEFAAGQAKAAGSLNDVEVTPGRVVPGSVATYATFTVTNRSELPIQRMYVTCSLLDDKGSPKDVKEESVNNIPAKQTVYGSVYFQNTNENGRMTCRVSEVD